MYPRAAPRGVSLRLVAIVAGLAVCALGLVLLVILLRETFDPLARQAAADELARRAAISSHLYWLDLLVAGLWRLLPLLAVGGAVWLGLLTVYNRWGGRAAAASDKMIDLQRARTQWLPSALQSLNYHDSSRPQLTPGPLSPLLELPAPAAPAVPTVPTFSELLATNMIAPGRPLILGYTANGPLYGSWLDLFSVGIGGLQGSGKTWTAVYLACQSVLNGALLALIDKHAGDKESLATRLAALSATFLCEPASDDKAILMLIDLTMAEYQRRLDNPQAPRRPFLFVVDEYTALMRGPLAGPLSQVSEMLNEEGRKLDMFGLYMGQIWKGSRSGGTEARDALASCYIHRIKPRQGQMLSGLGDDLPDDVLHLPDGTAYLVTTQGTVERVTIPRMSTADLAHVAQLLAPQSSPAPAAPESAPRPFGFQPLRAIQPMGSQESSKNHPLPSVKNTASESDKAKTPEEARIIALFLEGKDAGEIVTILTGMKSNGGKPYIRKLGEVQAIIRDELRRRRGESV